MKNKAGLKNKVGIITGGAGGIGKAIAKRFLIEGASIALADISEPELSAVLDEIRELNQKGKFIGIPADISNVEDIQSLIEQTLAKFGSIDILVNAGGIQGPIGPFVDINFEDWIKNIDINLKGTVLCCKCVLPAMMSRKEGKIINFSGGGATFSRPNFSAYSVAKAGVVKFTEILADELRPFNIQVNAISPGVIKTRMIDEIIKAGPDRGGPDYQQMKSKKEADFDSPELAAELVCFLASDKSNWLTGKVISAVWDPWKEWKEKGQTELNKDIYVLRRIDGRNFLIRSR